MPDTLILTPQQIIRKKAAGEPIEPHEDELVIDNVPPGFRMFRLADDTFESDVVRLPEPNSSGN